MMIPNGLKAMMAEARNNRQAEEKRQAAKEAERKRKEHEIKERKRIESERLSVSCEFVDLGLSVLWATCNLGANTPEEFGNYYAWGEIELKQQFLENNYTAGKFTKSSLDAKHDPATKLLGEGMKTPTRDDFYELQDKCTITPDTLNRIEGYKVIGPNGNSIFLPSAGLYNSKKEGAFGQGGIYYWSSDKKSKDLAVIFMIEDEEYSCWWCDKSYGLPIRPVKDK